MGSEGGISRFFTTTAAVPVFQLLFLVTGVFDTLGKQELFYQGAANAWALVVTIPYNLGMFLCIFLPDRDRKKGKVEHHKVMFMSICDFLSVSFCIFGLIHAGSGIFVIIYSSITIWTAILSRIFLKRILTRVQVFGIVLITLGLMVSAWGVEHSNTQSKKQIHEILLGVFCTFVGTLALASEYTFGEYLLSKEDCPSPMKLCWCVGAYNTAFNVLYILVYTIPRWEKLVAHPIRMHHGDLTLILLIYGGLTLSSTTHNVSWFSLLKLDSAVGTGVLQAVRAVLVFGLSALFFCHRSVSQCYTVAKAASTTLVVLGVIIYSMPAAAYEDLCVWPFSKPYKKIKDDSDDSEEKGEAGRIEYESFTDANVRKKTNA